MLVDSELLRMAMRQILQQEHCNLVGEVASSDSLLDLFSDGHVDVLVVKPSAVRDDLRDWIARVKAESHVKVLLLLTSPAEFHETCHSGAEGFMLTDSPTYLFPVALRVLHEGGCWIGPVLARALLQAEQRVVTSGAFPAATSGSHEVIAHEDLLTTKEREVMRHLTEGRTNAQIAAHLQLSVETVRVHVRNILRKLGVRDRNEAVQKSGQFQLRGR